MKSKKITSKALTTVLSIFDRLMANMTDARVPVNGRILYVTPFVMSALKNSPAVSRNFSVKSDGSDLNRSITTLDGVTVVEVPTSLMKTAYKFDNGWEPADNAELIAMMLIHPESVITPVSYEFACIDEPSAATGGKYAYYEESFEDVFVLNNRADGIAFIIDN